MNVPGLLRQEAEVYLLMIEIHVLPVATNKHILEIYVNRRQRGAKYIMKQL
jgi:hypothetical protein